MIDWENHRTSDKAVLCLVQIRPDYNGRAMKPETQAMNGYTVPLIALFFMDEGDKYPGEWALCLAAGWSYPSAFKDMNWIASGDVVPVQEKRADPEDLAAAGVMLMGRRADHA